MTAAITFVVVFVPMLVEAVISARNDLRLRARGAREPAGDVFRAMQVMYPTAFLAMILEAAWRQPGAGRAFAGGLALFTASKCLKYWAMVTLGRRWTFRVLVPPHSERIVRGPYRFLRHPNYLAVVGELLGAGLMTQAIATTVPATVAFALLIRRRIAVEERALGGSGDTEVVSGQLRMD